MRRRSRSLRASGEHASGDAVRRRRCNTIHNTKSQAAEPHKTTYQPKASKRAQGDAGAQTHKSYPPPQAERGAGRGAKATLGGGARPKGAGPPTDTEPSPHPAPNEATPQRRGGHTLLPKEGGHTPRRTATEGSEGEGGRGEGAGDTTKRSNLYLDSTPSRTAEAAQS